jgi:hypothetical protein
MRKLPPTKAIAHALRSVRDFAPVGIRFSLRWTVILLAIGLVTLLTSDEPRPGGPATAMSPLEFVSAIVGLVAFCSIAVNWHRYILRDETGGQPMRMDQNVWRYLGNSLLVVLMAVAPVFMLGAILLVLPPVAAVLLAPAAIVAGTFAMTLSLKLPAVALGRTDFGFRDALEATRDNFWQMMGVFLINGAIALLAGAIVLTLVSAVMAVNYLLGALLGLALSMVFNIFYTLFSVSVLSSLYGYFVEKRDF